MIIWRDIDCLKAPAQIVAGMQAEAFYIEHGKNVKIGRKKTRTISPRSVKVYIERIRRALQTVFDDAKVKLDSFTVLTSETTETNEVRYRLRGSVKWVHIEVKVESAQATAPKGRKHVASKKTKKPQRIGSSNRGVR